MVYVCVGDEIIKIDIFSYRSPIHPVFLVLAKRPVFVPHFNSLTRLSHSFDEIVQFFFICITFIDFLLNSLEAFEKRIKGILA